MNKADPYLKPILISSLVVLLLVKVLTIPILSIPLLTYFLGGILAVFLFKRQFKGESLKEIKFFDISVLGIGTGVVAGGLLAFMAALEMRDPETQRKLIEMVNQATQMQGGADLRPIIEITPQFVTATAVMVMIVCAIISFFGSLCTLPFVNKKLK